MFAIGRAADGRGCFEAASLDPLFQSSISSPWCTFRLFRPISRRVRYVSGLLPTKLFVIFNQLVDLFVRHIFSRLSRLWGLGTTKIGRRLRRGIDALICGRLVRGRDHGSIESRGATGLLTACLLTAKIRSISWTQTIVHALSICTTRT